MEVFHPTLLKRFIAISVISQVAIIGGSPFTIGRGTPRETVGSEWDKNAIPPPHIYDDDASNKAAMWGYNTDDKKDQADNVELDLIQVAHEDYEQRRILAQWIFEYGPRSEYFAPTLKDGNWMPTPEELKENEAEIRLAVKAISADYPYGYLRPAY